MIRILAFLMVATLCGAADAQIPGNGVTFRTEGGNSPLGFDVVDPLQIDGVSGVGTRVLFDGGVWTVQVNLDAGWQVDAIRVNIAAEFDDSIAGEVASNCPFGIVPTAGLTVTGIACLLQSTTGPTDLVHFTVEVALNTPLAGPLTDENIDIGQLLLAAVASVTATADPTYDALDHPTSTVALNRVFVSQGATTFDILSAGGAGGVDFFWFNFLRGDANGDGDLNLADPVFFLAYLFPGTVPAINCLEAWDTNDDDALDLSDAIYMLDYLTSMGPPPPGPFANPFTGADCRGDPTVSVDLICEESYGICP